MNKSISNLLKHRFYLFFSLVFSSLVALKTMNLWEKMHMHLLNFFLLITGKKEETNCLRTYNVVYKGNVQQFIFSCIEVLLSSKLEHFILGFVLKIRAGWEVFMCFGKMLKAFNSNPLK